MIASTIRHGQLTIEFESDKLVRLVRQDNGQHIEFSMSEWLFVLKAAELMGWPIAPPAQCCPHERLVDNMNRASIPG